jgi:hypothetical protein
VLKQTQVQGGRVGPGAVSTKARGAVQVAAPSYNWGLQVLTPELRPGGMTLVAECQGLLRKKPGS